MGNSRSELKRSLLDENQDLQPEMNSDALKCSMCHKMTSPAFNLVHEGRVFHKACFRCKVTCVWCMRHNGTPPFGVGGRWDGGAGVKVLPWPS